MVDHVRRFALGSDRELLRFVLFAFALALSRGLRN